MVKVDLRTITLQIPPQEVITKDNVPVRVNAVAYFRIVDPKAAIVQIENYMVATSQIAQTTLRSVLGQHSLDELLSEREKINAILQGIIDEQTAPWGIKVSIVEVKDVEIPQGMQRAMARQAEAERERRAKVINAEGEFQASERLKDAALVIEEHPVALQLRYLQTLLELGSSQSTTIVFPAPIDIISSFLPKNRQTGLAGVLRRDPVAGRWVAIAPARAARPGGAATRRGRARELPLLRRARRPDAAGDAPARRRPDRMGRARRAEPLPGARAAGGRRPRAGAQPLARGARRRDARPGRRGLAAARAGHRRHPCSRARQRGPRGRRERCRTRTRSSPGCRARRPRCSPSAACPRWSGSSRATASSPAARGRAARRTSFRSRPSEASPDGLKSDLLAPALRLLAELVRRLHGLLGDELPPLNAWLHDGPHWHLELLPRTTRLAGLELGAGVWVNAVPPEQRGRAARHGQVTAERRRGYWVRTDLSFAALGAEAPAASIAAPRFRPLSLACLISITVSSASMS